MFALFRLRDKGLISSGEYARLAAAYHSCDISSTASNRRGPPDPHAPSDPIQLDLLARKCRPKAPAATLTTGETLKEKLDEPPRSCPGGLRPGVHAQKPMYYTIPPESPAAPERGRGASSAGGQPGAPLGTGARRQLAEAVAKPAWRRGIERFQHFLEKSVGRRRPPELLGRRPPSWPPRWLFDIFEHSFHFADSLLRYPERWMRLGQAASTRRRTRWKRPRLVGAFYPPARCCASRGKAFSKRPHLRHPGQDSALADKVIDAWPTASPSPKRRRRPALPTARGPDDGDRTGPTWACASSTWARDARPGLLIPDAGRRRARVLDRRRRTA